MNAAWDLWIISYGVFTLTFVTLFMVILHLDEKEEEHETALSERNGSPQRRSDKYD